MSSVVDTFVTIVSGLPRSGTSMMMRMLESGGIPVMTDGIREADDDNPGGYYEFEIVKQSDKEHEWLPQAGGKAVKMIYRLLYNLPATHQYRVLFMRRKIEEVLASQKKMLERNGKAGDNSITDEQMAAMFRSQLAKFEKWVAEQPNFQLIDVNYNAMLADPVSEIAKINEFLGGGLNTEAMAQVVNPKLYRNRG
jgi:LPS sulfotransferase NodH